jgi:hypothetical protein
MCSICSVKVVLIVAAPTVRGALFLHGVDGLGRAKNLESSSNLLKLSQLHVSEHPHTTHCGESRIVGMHEAQNLRATAGERRARRMRIAKDGKLGAGIDELFYLMKSTENVSFALKILTKNVSAVGT